jgi:hypothetical protein
MKIDEITKREAELIRLCVEAKETSKQFAEAVQFAALQAEASPAVVRRYIAALANEKANTVIAEAGQLVMLFNAMPSLTEGLPADMRVTVERAA